MRLPIICNQEVPQTVHHYYPEERQCMHYFTQSFMAAHSMNLLYFL